MRKRNRNVPLKGKTKIAVIGDGQCEYWYIQMLKRNEKFNFVDLKPEIPQKKSLQEQFNLVLEMSGDYDTVLWIVDLDAINAETLSAKKGAKTAMDKFGEFCNKIKGDPKIITVINNPCLEYWFLLHFESTSKYFSKCDDATKHLKKHLPDYEKSQSYYTKQGNDIYLKLKPRLAAALINAKKLPQFDFQQPHMGLSQMHLLFSFEELRQQQDQ